METEAPGPKIPTSVERAVELLVEQMQPRKIILFGSTARGEADPESDLDLLVILDRVDSRFAEMNRAYDTLAPLRLSADVIVYSQQEVEEWGDVIGTVIYEALIEGRVVYDAAWRC